MPACSAWRMPRWSAFTSSGLERGGRRERMDLRPPERLVGVDVPDAGDRPLVEDRRLHRRPPPCELLGQVLGPYASPSGSRPDPRVDVRVHFGRFEQQPRAEAAHVAVGDVRSVV